jgi:hypothetical protein
MSFYQLVLKEIVLNVGEGYAGKYWLLKMTHSDIIEMPAGRKIGMVKSVLTAISLSSFNGLLSLNATKQYHYNTKQ